MAEDDQTAELGRALRETLRPRAQSLIATVWGDSIAPHGGSVWLGSLIRLLRPLGVNERAVRTAVFRLQGDDWLTSRQIGRRSYYSLTAVGRRRFAAADRRIYAARSPPWRGGWHVVLANGAGLGPDVRDRLRRELALQGFGVAAPGCYAHPAADVDALSSLLRDLDLAQQVAVLTADSTAMASLQPLKRMVESCWDLDRLDGRWREMLDRFEPLAQALEGRQVSDPEAGFVLRSLLIHEFRRVLLRDPALPEELLPADWSGTSARQLCRDLYRRLWRPAERYLMAVLETDEGPLPAATADFHRRFGGLARASDHDAAG